MRDFTTTPTQHDLSVVSARYADFLKAYLEGASVQFDADGLPKTALTGDEDKETIERYQRELIPLAKLYRYTVELAQQDTDGKPTWHSQQFEVLACTGHENDDRIANIYRESLIAR